VSAVHCVANHALPPAARRMTWRLCPLRHGSESQLRRVAVLPRSDRPSRGDQRCSLTSGSGASWIGMASSRSALIDRRAISAPMAQTGIARREIDTATLPIANSSTPRRSRSRRHLIGSPDPGGSRHRHALNHADSRSYQRTERPRHRCLPRRVSGIPRICRVRMRGEIDIRAPWLRWPRRNR